MARDISFSAPRSGLGKTTGGLAALAYPVILVAVSLNTGFWRGGDVGELATSFLAALLFLVAAPTAWIFDIPYIEAGRFTVVVVGVVTSFPLWYLLGSRLADASRTWQRWLARYVVACFAWTALTIVALGVVGLVSG